MGENERCPDHSEICRALGKIENAVEILPQLLRDVQAIKVQNARSIGFIAGVSAVVSLIVTFIAPRLASFFSTVPVVK